MVKSLNLGDISLAEELEANGYDQMQKKIRLNRRDVNEQCRYKRINSFLRPITR